MTMDFLLQEDNTAILQEDNTELVINQPAFRMVLSTNITSLYAIQQEDATAILLETGDEMSREDSTGDPTTAQLSAPAGKTTADFGGGRVEDNSNPTDLVDVGLDQYREDEWAIVATNDADLGRAYEFRLVYETGDTPLYTYNQTPTIVINMPNPQQKMTQLDMGDTASFLRY